VGLSEDLARVAAAAQALLEPGEELAAVIPAEPAAAERVYLCACERGGARSAWLALDDAGALLHDAARVRDAVSIAALCELAEEHAGGDDLDALAAQLESVRADGQADGVVEALDALEDLRRTIGVPPRLATPARLDAVGEAARRLELALGDDGRSPFAEAMKNAHGVVDELVREVQGTYRGELI
jgi:hypothetical protein